MDIYTVHTPPLSDRVRHARRALLLVPRRDHVFIYFVFGDGCSGPSQGCRFGHHDGICRLAGWQVVTTRCTSSIQRKLAIGTETPQLCRVCLLADAL